MSANLFVFHLQLSMSCSGEFLANKDHSLEFLHLGKRFSSNLGVLFFSLVSKSDNLELFCLQRCPLYYFTEILSGYDINIQTTPAFYLLVGNCEGEDVEKHKLGKAMFLVFTLQLM